MRRRHEELPDVADRGQELMVTVCTIAARNYIAHVRVLASSFLQHHPDGRFIFLVIDDESRQFDAGGEPFECVRLSDIGLDRAEIGRLATIYDVTEFSTAVKPLFLQHLLADSAGSVLYLDPDIKVFGSLDSVSQLSVEHSIVLTPHVTRPMRRDDRRIDEFQVLASGIYNLGFVGVGPGSGEFLDWWWTKTRREARSDPARMMFTDQRWVDFVPGLWNHFILRDTSYNVAYWNLGGRALTWDGSRYDVDGRPLTFFHFSGFDARKPYLLSKHQGDRPRVLLSENPALQRICVEYVADLADAAHERESVLPYGWSTLPSGHRLSQRLRRVYREGLEAHEKHGAPEPPCPFDGPERFIAWLAEPVPVGIRARIPRYMYAIYQDRGDLRQAFPNLAGEDGPRFAEWTRISGFVEEDIPFPIESGDSLGTDLSTPQFAPASNLSEGVNIVGYFQAEVGVGEAARLLTTAVEAARIPHSTITFGESPSRKQHAFHERGDGTAIHDVNILCVNADQTALFAREAGARFFEGRRTAGYWFWELDHFPDTMHTAFDYVDEVWTATRFIASGIRTVGLRPVHTVPPPLLVPQCSPDIGRESLGLPSGFIFLYVFDFFSILERKNPIGLISAFQRAFRPNEGPVLVLKTINGDNRLNDLERVRAAVQDRTDILIVDKYYSSAEKNSIVNLCDCYVSLHRSEGLGLTMAEAMGLGKPVIATGYSGNIDFMTSDNSYLVDYEIGAVPDGCLPYPKGSPWAEPDLDQAAEYMRRVFERPDEAAARARQARQDILTKHNASVAGAVLAERVEKLRRTRIHVMRKHQAPIARAVAPHSVPSPNPQSPEQSMASLKLSEVDTLFTPTVEVASGRPFRRSLLLAQRLLFRVLRPYWFQQRQAQLTLIARIQDALSATMREPGTLRNALHQLDGRLTRLEGLPQSVSALQDSVNAFQHSAAAQLTRLDTLPHAVSTFQDAASAHLKALTDELVRVTSDASTLSQRLYATPFTNPPDRFIYSDGDGRRVLGFRSQREQQGDVYLGFEDVFRGSEALIRGRMQAYLPLLTRHDRIIEIGCGRGELLDLLRETGVPAVGVDVDEAMIRQCRGKGHTVEHVDALTFIRAQPDSSLSAIFSAQVVEHLSYDDLISFVQVCRAKLKPGGQLIFETVNPHALEAFKTFWTDLTHQKPIFPEVALAWCWLCGFEEGYVFFPNGVNDLEHDRRTQGEYAVVATKSLETREVPRRESTPR
jgi:glycosyltransferase involved in cell wall biosynthesis/2-polyprenyl-3-methyl-5-hydroxy-6-metoxy-1,4-benzoquinol methylase